MARRPRARTVRPAARRRGAASAFDALLIEGALIAPAQMTRIAALDAGEQDDAGYRVRPGLTIRDELPLLFKIAQAHFRTLDASATQSQPAAMRFTEGLLRDVLGFADLAAAPLCLRDGRVHPVTFTALDGRVPVVVASREDGLDGFSNALTRDGRRTSAALGLQDWLNATDRALWGMACDGERLRLYRDNPSLTRPAYIEADLRRMCEADAFADFTVMWLLLHASRFGAPDTTPADCALERWRDAGQKAGLAARDRLRDGVEQALQVLGTGFVGHVANGGLRRDLQDNTLPLTDFHGLLLRLVYRMIFLLVAEDRGLLHPPDASPAATRLYAEGYSLSRLRDRAIRRAAWDAHDDLWDGMLIVFGKLGWGGEPTLGLSVLDGLFAPSGLGALEDSALPNRALVEAVFRLAWLRDEGALVPVNWRDMETEELGSVYESLLELTPRLSEDGRVYGFATADAETRGNQRRDTGSYYTPDSLVQLLLDQALDPVLDRVERESVDQVSALLGLAVLDPACGSGHFLLSAARRIAARVARLRAGGAARPSDYRHALREVARSCLFGVDRNPMAVELAKVAIWIETVEPGKPLGFLDANVRCGDALLGVSKLALLDAGIPDAAYKAVEGDDDLACRELTLRNRDARSGQGLLDVTSRASVSVAPMADVEADWRAMPEDSPEQIAAKRDRLKEARSDPGSYALMVACDLYVAAFLMSKREGAAATPGASLVPTTKDVWDRRDGRQVYPPREGQAVDVARGARAFHWPLEFPAIMARGGFDVVLGNPPWKPMSPDAKEFFSQYDPGVRFLSPEDQKTRFEELRGAPGVQGAWDSYCHSLYVSAQFFKGSGRYTLFAAGNLGKGDFNVYRMFTETALRLVRQGGRAAQFVPENLYNGANAAAIRLHLFSQCRLHALIGFENTARVWFDIDTRAKFCLYVASPGGPTENFPAAFGVDSPSKIAALGTGLPFDMSVALVREFSPDALAIAEIAHASDLAITRKLYARFPKFGQSVAGLAVRDYSRELDMGNDREDFTLAQGDVPVYEGRMVDAFDHRAKAWISGRGRAAVWRELSFGSADKAICPQWRIAITDVPDKIGDLWRRYRIGFCDVASPTNQRAFVAALIPPDTVCGHSVPTVEIDGAGVHLTMFLLGVMNSFAIDFVVKPRVALHMTFTLVDSLPLPRVYSGLAVEVEIARRSLRLTATGTEMREYWNEAASLLGLDIGLVGPVEDVEERRRLRAEVDVLVARDLYGLTRNEMRYLLDPADILGPETAIESFGALKRAEERSFRCFLTRDLILDAWDRPLFNEPADLLAET